MFDQARRSPSRFGDRNRTSVVLTNIGEVYCRMGNPTEAISVLEQAEGLFDELGDRLGLAEALRGLGKAYMLKGDLPKARDCISRAVDLLASARSKVNLGISRAPLGEITAAGGWGSAHTKLPRVLRPRRVDLRAERQRRRAGSHLQGLLPLPARDRGAHR